jgi:putative AlgH/UPF0301 family transcriptional regulator
MAASILTAFFLPSSTVRSFRPSIGFGSPSHLQNPSKLQSSAKPIEETISAASSSNAFHLKELHNTDELREGSLVLSRVESSLGCHDLRQPYMHKAVVLVLDHDPDDFTQGVILNRASDLTLNDRDIVYVDDDDSVQKPLKDVSWKVHFGGDIASWYEDVPQLLCVHGISSEAARAVSDPIFDDGDGVYITSHMGARSLVESGDATPDMFYTFSGFCGWEKDQLQKEVDRGSWCLASFDVDLETTEETPNDEETKPQKHMLMELLEQYSWKNSEYKPQSAGLELWSKLMAWLGNDTVESEQPKDNHQTFSDLMAREWATQRLLVTKSNNNDDNDERSTIFGGETTGSSQIDDEDIFRALRVASAPPPLTAGSIFRASSSPSSPYLLDGQFFHKSTILLIQDSPDSSVGVILNLPTKESQVLKTQRGDYSFPIRYGGPSGTTENGQMFWLHDSKKLKAAGIGVPVIKFSDNFPNLGHATGPSSCVYVCQQEDVRRAIESGEASPEDFLLVKGFCAWDKGAGSSGGLTGQILDGNIEDTHWWQKTPTERDLLWNALRFQKRLESEMALRHNLALSLQAWKRGASNEHKAADDESHANTRHVFDSTVDVSKLADDALFVWMKIFLLGNGVYTPGEMVFTG